MKKKKTTFLLKILPFYYYYQHTHTHIFSFDYCFYFNFSSEYKETCLLWLIYHLEKVKEEQIGKQDNEDTTN